MKTALISLIFLLKAVSGFCQNWYLGLNTGYGFPILKDAVANSGKGSFINSGGYTKSYFTSLGKGIYLNLNIGRNIDSNSFYEAGIRYWKSDAINFSSQGFATDIDNSPSILSKYTASANNIFLVFSYGIKYPLTQKWHLYGKAGVLAGKNYLLVDEQWYNYGYQPSPPSEKTYKYLFTTAYGFGFSSSFGTQYKINNKISVTGELFFQLQNAKLKKREITTYTEDGTDKLSTLPSNQKEWDYYSGKPTNIYDKDDLKNKHAPSAIPMSSLGINIGINYTF
jgi:hypothetical protein